MTPAHTLFVHHIFPREMTGFPCDSCPAVVHYVANEAIPIEISENKLLNNQTKPSRRGFFFGAAATGAAVAAVVALPRVAVPQAEILAPLPLPEKGGGYSLSEHVKRYYKTTRI